MITPEQAVDSINARFGAHPHYRALHAKGLVAAATFTATPSAAALSRAAHLTGAAVPALVRVSNGSGDPSSPDFVPDVRGLAVSFELPDGARTVISAQTAPKFGVSTPDAFIAMVRALQPSQAWRLPLLLARNPRLAASLPANARALRPPASYATLTYHAIHAFRWIAADGSSRFVRYTWRPEAGVSQLSAREAKQLGRDYLGEEFRARLGRGPIRFTLLVQIAEDGDDVNDPSVVWPSSRRTVEVGRLEITEVVDEPPVLVFDPTAITDGIELSDDPVLRFRAGAYTVSVDRRLQA